MLTACEGPAPGGFGAAQPASVALQPDDLPVKLQKCPGGGDLETFAEGARKRGEAVYRQVRDEWQRLRAARATASWVQGLAEAPSACSLFSLSPAEKLPRVAVSFVVRFRDSASAAQAYRRTFLGLNPEDQAPPYAITKGKATGLGPNAIAASLAIGGETFYSAFWQNHSFVVSFQALNVPGARQAAARIDGRIH